MEIYSVVVVVVVVICRFCLQHFHSFDHCPDKINPTIQNLHSLKLRNSLKPEKSRKETFVWLESPCLIIHSVKTYLKFSIPICYYAFWRNIWSQRKCILVSVRSFNLVKESVEANLSMPSYLVLTFPCMDLQKPETLCWVTVTSSNQNLVLCFKGAHSFAL